MFLLLFCGDLNKFNNLTSPKENKKEEKEVCIIMLRNYTMTI